MLSTTESTQTQIYKNRPFWDRKIWKSMGSGALRGERPPSLHITLLGAIHQGRYA